MTNQRKAAYNIKEEKNILVVKNSNNKNNIMAWMMMTNNSIQHIPYQKSRSEDHEQQPITTTIPAWKLYENPFYNNPDESHNHNHNQNHHGTKNSIQCLQLPLSARKLAASFWELPFFRPTAMDSSELDQTNAQIADLRAELDAERRARTKLAKELSDERRAKESAERACERLAREMAQMRSQFEEEKKMLRMCEVLREERVQMKLADAKIVFEEKLSELETTRFSGLRKSNNPGLSGKLRQLVLGERVSNEDDSESVSCDISATVLQKKWVCVESENPHIKRGIKGFVEFPRVVRAIGAKNRQWGSKLECQKAQLRIFLRQKSTIRSSSDCNNNNLVMS